MAELRVERQPCQPRLDRAIHVLDTHVEQRIHLAQVEAHGTATRRDNVSLERSAGSKRDKRHTMLGAKPHDGLHLLSRPGIGDCRRRLRRVVRLVVAMPI